MAEKDYGMLVSNEEMAPFFKKVLGTGEPFAFDIESGYDGAPTNDISKMTFHPRWKLVGFSFSSDPSWARYVPIAHDNGPNANPVAAARLLWNLLQTGRGVPHNATYELQGLSRWFRETLWDDNFFGEAVRKSNGMYPIFSDTMIEAHMVQKYMPLSNGKGVGVGLKGLVKHIFGHQMTELTSLFPDLKKAGTTKQLRFNTLDLNDESITYACEDSAWTLELHRLHYSQVKDSLMFRTEIQLLPVLCEMEQEGLVLDWDEYERQKVIIENFKNALNEEIQNDLSQKLGEVVNVNFNSPKQVQALLYEKMGLPLQLNKKTERPTADDKALNHLARVSDDPSLLKILEWRSISKLLSAYIVKYLDELHYDPTGRARPSHNQLGAGTGRFSVDGVSYQQWPKKYHFELSSGEALDLNYKNFLIAPEGFRVVGYDFAQVEMRVLAGVVGEDSMIEAFNEGQDLHQKTASVMFKIPLDEVTPEQRQAAKSINFGLLYGQGAAALAETLNITKSEAQGLIDDYFDGFPKLRDWMDRQVRDGQISWEVFTPFGRKFHIWNYDDAADLERRAESLTGEKREGKLGLARYVFSEGNRLCVNAAIQGGAADYMKIGMVRASKAIKRAGLEDKIKLIMTIHDALEFYVHESVSTQEVIDLLNPAVSFPIDGWPEILPEWHEGHKWGSVVEVELDKNKKITGYSYSKHTFDTIEEAYEFMQNPPEKPSEAPVSEDIPSEPYLLGISLPEAPNAAEWLKVQDYLRSHSGGNIAVDVSLDGQEKRLNLKVQDVSVEELEELIPAADIRLYFKPIKV